MLRNRREQKRHQDVAPLQPPTLALFPAWGSSAGAGRILLPNAKVLRICYLRKVIVKIAAFYWYSFPVKNPCEEDYSYFEVRIAYRSFQPFRYE